MDAQAAKPVKITVTDTGDLVANIKVKDQALVIAPVICTSWVFGID